VPKLSHAHYKNQEEESAYRPEKLHFLLLLSGNVPGFRDPGQTEREVLTVTLRASENHMKGPTVSMSKLFLMGNEAIALGAMHAGVNFVSGYPGTPSTEILECVSRQNGGQLYVEWSVNEKAAMEVAAGASYAGARTLVTMKQVGLNVASDPLMSLAYIGVKGGMVVVVADDPGPISSQTEQDTRHFARFAKLPVFDPSSPEEAYEMVQDAFDYSERYNTPVLLRPTTRVCHGCASVTVREEKREHRPDGFVKDTMRWVIFPGTSYQNHCKIERRNPEIGDDFSTYRFNSLTGGGKKGSLRRDQRCLCPGGAERNKVRSAPSEGFHTASVPRKTGARLSGRPR
jgi:TPP-dependent indolepyruvate ferredoxin oxidoreductase alpha subunit